MVSRALSALVAAICVVVVTLDVRAQQATTYVPKQSDRSEPVAGDEAGFQPIFDGKTRAGWEGIKSNTFVVWRGGKPKDFELELDYRITPEGNATSDSRTGRGRL